MGKRNPSLARCTFIINIWLVVTSTTGSTSSTTPTPIIFNSYRRLKLTAAIWIQFGIRTALIRRINLGCLSVTLVYMIKLEIRAVARLIQNTSKTWRTSNRQTDRCNRAIIISVTGSRSYPINNTAVNSHVGITGISRSAISVFSTTFILQLAHLTLFWFSSNDLAAYRWRETAMITI